jgi:hypothetical protein
VSGVDALVPALERRDDIAEPAGYFLNAIV